MIAADVHGKNHHKDGSFAKYVEWIDLLTSDGSKTLSAIENSDLFKWTLGGMGLTGIVLRAAIRLRPVQSGWIEQRTLVADNIGHTIELFEQSHNVTYSVAWIDCLQGKSIGRSLVMMGEHADAVMVPSKYRKTPLQIPRKRKLRIPLEFPSWLLNGLSVRAFNELYYWNGKRKRDRQLVDWDSYFYPRTPYWAGTKSMDGEVLLSSNAFCHSKLRMMACEPSFLLLLAQEQDRF